MIQGEKVEGYSSYRLAFFIGGLFVFTILGVIFSYRISSFSSSYNKAGRLYRWINNLLLGVSGAIVSRFLYFLFPIAISASYSQNKGLFSLIELNLFWRVLLCVIVLDLLIYFQHLVFHKVPILWRLHRVHHTDTEFDTTTALRFHPLEIALSILIKSLFVFILGIDPLSLLVFEIVLNFSAMFNHSNFSLPRYIEKLCVQIIVTPDMHRIHHSVIKNETNSNYGFCLSVWDKVFKTYLSQPISNPRLMDIGLEDNRGIEDHRLDHLLKQPFR